MGGLTTLCGQETDSTSDALLAGAGLIHLFGQQFVFQAAFEKMGNANKRRRFELSRVAGLFSKGLI